jgi:hypothetical protein
MPHRFNTLFIAGLLAGLALPAALAAQPAPSAEAAEDSLSRLQAVYHFGHPLDVMARARAGVPALNTMAYQDKANDPRPIGLARPDADLLHASAWLDLSSGPVVLDMPALAGRYHAVAITSMAGDLLALLGTRTGSQGGRFALVSTDYAGPYPDGATPLRLGCRSCRLVARVLVRGPDDLATAREALAGITLQAEATPASPKAKDWLGRVNMVIAEEGPSSIIGQKAAQLPALAEPAEVWAKTLPALRAALQETLPTAFPRVNGWSYPPFPIADAAADDITRAQIATLAPDALPRVELMEITTSEDEAGVPLSGSKAYRLRLPYNLPAGGYWSVSMYAPGKDGQLDFVANELGRFAVGDRSDHLRADRNGSTELFIQAARPQGERVVNWLPAPQGHFTLVFRAALPKAELLDGSFRLPPVTPAEPVP